MSGSSSPPVPTIIRARYQEGTLEIVVPTSMGITIDGAAARDLEGTWTDLEIAGTPVRLRFWFRGTSPRDKDERERKRKSRSSGGSKSSAVIDLAERRAGR